MQYDILLKKHTLRTFLSKFLAFWLTINATAELCNCWHYVCEISVICVNTGMQMHSSFI